MADRQSLPTVASPVFEAGGVTVDISPSKNVTGNYFGTATTQMVSNHMALVKYQHSPSADSVRMCEAVQVNATSTAHMTTPQTLVTGTTPAMPAFQQSAKLPHFDGDDRHWVDVVRDWTRYSAHSLLNAPGGPLGDIIKRDLLVNCLTGALKKEVDNVILRNPATTFVMCGTTWRRDTMWMIPIDGERSGHKSFCTEARMTG
jgi:hypothetical protein